MQSCKEEMLTEDVECSVQPKKITENEQFGKFIDNYLWAGETAFDYGVAFMGGSKYFERKR
jgi:hypothetical protein